MTKSTGVGRGNNPASHVKRASGNAHHRWSDERMLSEHGYVKVRVGKDHPLADANGYCYEHLLVWVSAGREEPDPAQLLHHENEVKTDNRLSNLKLLNRVAHAAEHQGERMLTDDQVRTVRERFAAGEGGTALAAEFGVPFQRVYRIVNREGRDTARGWRTYSDRFAAWKEESMTSIGKKAAGRLLDGVEHNRFPEVRNG